MLIARSRWRRWIRVAVFGVAIGLAVCGFAAVWLFSNSLDGGTETAAIGSGAAIDRHAVSRNGQWTIAIGSVQARAPTPAATADVGVTDVADAIGRGETKLFSCADVRRSRSRDAPRRPGHSTSEENRARERLCRGVADPFLIRVRDTKRPCTYDVYVDYESESESENGVSDSACTDSNSLWYLFFELMSARTDAPSTLAGGRIAVASSRAGLDWRYEGIAFSLPASTDHVSFPFVFAVRPPSPAPPSPLLHKSVAYFLLPQFSGVGLPLWSTSAEAFPFGWEQLPRSIALADPIVRRLSYRDSIVFHMNRTWNVVTMQTVPTATGTGTGRTSDLWSAPDVIANHKCLIWFESTDLFAPFTQRNRRAVCFDVDRSGSSERIELRPAGRVLRSSADGGSELLLLLQRSTPYYGYGVDAFRLHALFQSSSGSGSGSGGRASPLDAAATIPLLLRPSQIVGSFNELGMHSLDLHRTDHDFSRSTTALFVVDGLSHNFTDFASHAAE